MTVFAGDDTLTTALLDRLAHHATVLTTKGKSYEARASRRHVQLLERGSRLRQAPGCRQAVDFGRALLNAHSLGSIA